MIYNIYRRKTDSRASYKEGDILFISHNNVLTLKLVK